MNLLIILLAIILMLFTIAYFTKRRYGVLGLALIAGVVLSDLWKSEVTAFIQGAGIELLTPPLPSLVGAGIILLPAVIILFSGPKYSNKMKRLIGGVVFAILATTLLLGQFSNGLNLDDNGMKIYTFLTGNSTLIVTAAIGYALYDVFTHKPPKLKEEHKGKGKH